MAVSHKDCRPKSLVGLYGRILTSVTCTHLTAFGLYSTTSVKILPYRPPARLTRAHKDRNLLPENIKAIIIIIITLFKSQFILAEHECSTNLGDWKRNNSNQIIKSNKSNTSNQIKCWFLRKGENRSTRRKTSRSRVENQQTQSTYDAGSGNRTWDTLVEGERSHYCANPAPHV